MKRMVAKNKRGYTIILELPLGMSPTITLRRPEGQEKQLFYEWFQAEHACEMYDLLIDALDAEVQSSN